jgi:glycolate oxidase subunit GlcD
LKEFVLSPTDFIKELGQLLSPEQVLTGPAAMRGYDCDAYLVERAAPIAVCLPDSTDQVADLVRWCNRHQIPFTARGAGTGLSGGTLPALGGIVISTKRLQKILEIDIPNRQLLAEAGAVNKKLTDSVAAFGLHFAPDPSSQTVSTLGGNIAENAGGPHTLKYGVTSRHVVALTMVTVEGDVVRLGGRVPGGPGPDLLSLVIGGEGTLGIVTEAWVRLTPVPSEVQTALIAFAEVAQATTTVTDIIASGSIPAALEMMDRGILLAVQAAFALSYPQEAQALLLIECDAFGEGAQNQVDREMAIVRTIAEKHRALSFQTARDASERATLWTARKKSVGAMGRLAPSIVTHDGVIPRSKLPEMLEYVYAVANSRGLGVANMFHAGDGNLHPCFYFDDRDPEQLRKVVEAGEMIVRRCIDLGGSITGEHGIGVEKLDLMPLMFSPQDLDLQGMAKKIFNSGSLCNPCKVLPNQKSCVEHKGRWKGAAW